MTQTLLVMLLLGSCLLLAACGAGTGPGTPPQEPARPAYPATRRVDVRDTLHGVEVTDPYRWLEDEKAPEVREWMKAQGQFALARLRSLPERAPIAARLRELLYADEVFPPRHRGGRYFYLRRHASKEKAVVYWKEGKDGPEKVLFDPNTWSADGSSSLGTWSVSEDGKTVAYGVRANNADEATLYVVDVASGKKSSIDVIEGAKYAAASWTPDGKGFYYTWLPVDPAIKASERPGYQEFRYHRLGEDPKKDAVVRERTGDPTTFLGGFVSRDGRWLVSQVQHGWTSNDVWFRDLRSGETGWTTLVAGRKAVSNVAVWQDRFFIHTNDGAGRWRVFAVDPTNPARESWKEIVAEDPGATLENIAVVGGHLALTYTVDAATRLEIRTLEGKPVRRIALPGIGSSWGVIGEEDDDEAYFSFESFTIPREIHVTSIRSGETKLWGRVKLPLDPSPYVTEQFWFKSKDGARVPLFLVRRGDLKKNGNTPVILTGYGGFQVSLTPWFDAWVYPWLERGGAYAVVNLRGGNEFGESWHRSGMLDKKQNVFDDFQAAANFLIAQGYTSRSRLAIEGGSNGGLLVGAAMTQSPGLYGAVVCDVPLLDMIRYHLFGSGRTWIEEYGSAEDPAQFRTLLAYSPYQHVRDGVRYPALLLLSADSDDRVDPMHARKFAAAVQAASTGGEVLLRIETNAGHGGADMVKARIEVRADTLAFLCDHLEVGR